ncbi:unnamed protein product [marine sediment metagenome]|uniref:Uncharacterized protein n=1 Tax=marine sediment metagenome TaxID=412755 RepID=X0YUB5_9ZZZZ
MKYPLKQLIAHCIEPEGFNRMDLIPRYLAVGNHVGANDYGWDIYSKMMDIVERGKRTSEQQRENFISLIDTVGNETFDLEEHPLLFKTGTWRLADGAHRLSCALYFGHGTISMVMDNKAKLHDFIGIDWFEKRDFTREQVRQILRARDDIYKRLELL